MKRLFQAIMDFIDRPDRKRRHEDSAACEAKRRKSFPETPIRSLAEPPKVVPTSLPSSKKCLANERLRQLRNELEKSKNKVPGTNAPHTPDSSPLSTHHKKNVEKFPLQNRLNRSPKKINSACSQSGNKCNTSAWNLESVSTSSFPDISKKSCEIFQSPQKFSSKNSFNKQCNNGKAPSKSQQSRLSINKNVFQDTKKPSSSKNDMHLKQSAVHNSDRNEIKSVSTQIHRASKNNTNGNVSLRNKHEKPIDCKATSTSIPPDNGSSWKIPLSSHQNDSFAYRNYQSGNFSQRSKPERAKNNLFGNKNMHDSGTILLQNKFKKVLPVNSWTTPMEQPQTSSFCNKNPPQITPGVSSSFNGKPEKDHFFRDKNVLDSGNITLENKFEKVPPVNSWTTLVGRTQASSFGNKNPPRISAVTFSSVNGRGVSEPRTAFGGFGSPQVTFGSSESNVALIEESGMEWSPIFEEEMLHDIKIARVNISEQVQNETINHPQMPETLQTSVQNNNSTNNNIYVIVDTNVFMDKLDILANILHISYEDGSHPIIYVPWMVIQELDYFKDGYKTTERHVITKVMQNLSRRAIKFVNECLLTRRENFMCQSVQDATENRLKHTSPDDSILSCCFQVADRNRIILLTGDVNLRNKAIINKFDAHPPEEIIKVLGQKKQKIRANLVEKAKEKLSLTCSFIIYSECKRQGENVLSEEFKKMPWPLWECITFMRENYGRIFKPFLQKQCLKVIEDIYENFIIDRSLPNEKKFIELMLALLIYIKTGLPNYDANVQQAIDEIKKLEKVS